MTILRNDRGLALVTVLVSALTAWPAEAQPTACRARGEGPLASVDEPIHSAWRRWKAWYLDHPCTSDPPLLRDLVDAVRLECASVSVSDVSVQAQIRELVRVASPECASHADGSELLDPLVAGMYCPVGWSLDDRRLNLVGVTWRTYLIVWALWHLADTAPDSLHLARLAQHLAIYLSPRPPHSNVSGFERLIDSYLLSQNELDQIEPLLPPDDSRFELWARSGVFDLRPWEFSERQLDARAVRFYYGVFLLSRSQHSMRIDRYECSARTGIAFIRVRPAAPVPLRGLERPGEPISGRGVPSVRACVGRSPRRHRAERADGLVARALSGVRAACVEAADTGEDDSSFGSSDGGL